MFKDFRPPIQKIELDTVQSAQICLYVLRDDLSHPYLSGNKWRKLKYNLENFKASGKKAILSFGGKYSNHLIACAAAGKAFNIPMIGILRGEETVSNPNLMFLKNCGMKLLSISREEYRFRNDPAFLNKLFARCVKEFGEILTKPDELFLIPEGGSNPDGVKGCMEIINDIPESATHIVTACGTGSTLAGIAKSCRTNQMSIGISVLRGENFLNEYVLGQGASVEKFNINFDYHFGGYAKAPNDLLTFCGAFSALTNIPTEPVYTGKMFYGVMDLISKGFFPPGSKVVMVHTGGIFNLERNMRVESESSRTVN
ncbi:MAG: 1-aminocyclopropane-1-carboxylate deaminase/D-cysteine desulfhydrase [Bacteroidia bacterium]|nr:1-aminocyclopropane-1-carboxylate deaminase/D-cysteine desulfhydrase [Bacteroidia bacterium]